MNSSDWRRSFQSEDFLPSHDQANQISSVAKVPRLEASPADRGPGYAPKRVVGNQRRLEGIVPPSRLYSPLTPQEALRQITSYQDGVFDHRPVVDVGLRTRIGRLLPQRLRSSIRLLMTDFLRIHQRLRAKRLTRIATRKGRPIRLHLGSGALIKDEYFNIDLFGLPVDLCWNLKYTPLPFRERSVTLIFHEHVLEHLSQPMGLALTRDEFRMLEPGGVLRFAVPDPSLHYAAYANSDDGFFTNFGTFNVDIDAMNQLHYGEGHKCMYDQFALYRLLIAAGFMHDDIRLCEPGRSEFIEPDRIPDTPWRQRNSIYVEARVAMSQPRA